VDLVAASGSPLVRAIDGAGLNSDTLLAGMILNLIPDRGNA
jgi:hypothetical protein